MSRLKYVLGPQLKKRVETCEANFEINSQAIDDMNNALTETVKVLNDTLKKELAKMVTKEEFKVLEDKHNVLKNRVDELEKDIKERLEKMIKECMARIDVLTERIESVEDKIEKVIEHPADYRTRRSWLTNAGFSDRLRTKLRRSRSKFRLSRLESRQWKRFFPPKPIARSLRLPSKRFAMNLKQ